MFCDQCGKPVPPSATTCPHCGSSLAPMTVAVATPPPVPGPRRSGESVPEQRERPARLPPARAWLAGVLTRDVRSTASGVICAWFGVPWVLLMAAFGAVLGGIVGLVNGTMVGPGVLDRMDKIVGYVVPLPVKPLELLPTAAAQIGGIVAALIGAVSGGWKLGYMAATWPWEALYEGDPTWPWMVAVGQVVTALFVGALWVLGSSATEGLRLRIGGCRRMSRRERLWLAPLVAECARRLDITRPPVLLIHDRREPNAYALTRHVVINQGLLDDLGYDPVMVGGVVTHELAHWQEGHAISAAWAKGVALPLYLLYEIAVRLIDVTGRIRPLQWLLRVLLWSVTTTVRGIVIPIHAHTARANELAADDRVIEAGYAEGFRRALARLRFYEQGRDGWDRAVCATHPPIELRMERLESPGRRYPLRDDYALSAGLLGAPTSTVRRTE